MKVGYKFDSSSIILSILFFVWVFGYFRNIYMVATSGFDVINGMFVARVIGVFAAPLGAVLGLF